MNTLRGKNGNVCQHAKMRECPSDEGLSDGVVWTVRAIQNKTDSQLDGVCQRLSY